MTSENNIFHYQKVELEDEEEDGELPSRKSAPSNIDREKLSKELGSKKNRRKGGFKLCFLLLTILFAGAGISGYIFYKFYSSDNQARIIAASNETNTSDLVHNNSSRITTPTTTRAIQGSKAPIKLLNNSTRTNSSKNATADTIATTHASLHLKNATTKVSIDEQESHKSEWYKKYWEKYSNPHRWDWILLGLVIGISSTIALLGLLCLYCLCRSRRKMRRRHFERLLQDINASEKFSLVNSSDDEDSEP